jgi:hypothetical protein
MANGVATKAAQLSAGQSIGSFKGGKFHPMGTVSSVVVGTNGYLVYVEGSLVPYVMHPSTIVRVL